MHKTLLISRPDRVGDVIISTSCFSVIKQQAPHTKIVFIAQPNVASLLQNHPDLDDFIPIPKNLADSESFQSFAQTLKSHHADAIIHLHPDPLIQAAGSTAQIPMRVGYQESGSKKIGDPTLTHTRPNLKHLGLSHEAQYNLDLLSLVGIQPVALEQLNPNLSHLAECTPHHDYLKSIAIAEPNPFSSEPFPLEPFSLDAPFLVINPTAFSLNLRWPAPNFVEVAKALQMPTILVGEKSDDPSVVTVRSLLQSDPSRNFPFLDLCGKTNLAQLGMLLSRTKIFITRNTGSSHLAAAVGCPYIIELFGRKEPQYAAQRWRALRSKAENQQITLIEGNPGKKRWFESKKRYWIRGYEAISPETVIKAACAARS